MSAKTGLGRTRTYDVSYVTDLQSAVVAAGPPTHNALSETRTHKRIVFKTTSSSYCDMSAKTKLGRAGFEPAVFLM